MTRNYQLSNRKSYNTFSFIDSNSFCEKSLQKNSYTFKDGQEQSDFDHYNSGIDEPKYEERKGLTYFESQRLNHLLESLPELS